MDIWTKVDFSLYPKTMQRLAEYIGERRVRLLVREYRGQRLYVPKHATENHYLVETIGFEALENLSFAMGGLYITVPLCKRITNEYRNAKIKVHRQKGLSFADLIDSYNLSHSSLKLILS